MPLAKLLDVDSPELLPRMLQSIRLHFGMEVAFISEFVDGERLFRHVDAADGAPILTPGDGGPLDLSYCQRIVDGRLPELICDASQLPEANALPVTSELPIGAHLSVPIRLPDGVLYGTLCCFSRSLEPTLNQRDLSMMRVLADLAAAHIHRRMQDERAHDEAIARIRRVLTSDELSTVYQPIYDLSTGVVAGYECLSRFSGHPQRGPHEWFAEAAVVGLSAELELGAVRRALVAMDRLSPGCYLALNVSPTVPPERLVECIDGHPLSQIVIEITEHEVVEEYAHLTEWLAPLRKRGAKIAVDDAGAGFSSFKHILSLSPDFIKLDLSLTRGIDVDPARRALAAALVRFSQETGSQIIAEGVETAGELAALRDLGIGKAQGFYLGRPMPLGDILENSESCDMPACSPP